MNLRMKTGYSAGLLLALATLPTLHAAELKTFNASYRASYNNMAANATMSLAPAGANRWTYRMKVQNALVQLDRSSTVDASGSQLRPVGNRETINMLVKKKSKQANFDWSGGQVTWTGDVKSDRRGPVKLQAGDVDGMTLNLAIVRDALAGNMVYASYTRGFKPGGINTSSGAYQSFGWEDAIKPTYKNETVDSFEIGSKNRFADNTAQLNVSAFLYNYKNMQFLEEDPVLFGEGIANAPSARVYGLEAEGSWMVTPEFRLDASLSWLEGEFTGDYYALDPAAAQAAQNAAGFPDWLFWSNYYAASVARDGARQNIKGNRIPKLPRWQGNIAATYTGEVGPGTLTARAQLIYRGEYQYRLFNDSDVDTTPDYAQVNLMLKYQPEDTGFDITARITNLFDTAGVNSRFSDPYGSAQVMETYIPPRQFILSVGYRF